MGPPYQVNHNLQYRSTPIKEISHVFISSEFELNNAVLKTIQTLNLIIIEEKLGRYFLNGNSLSPSNTILTVLTATSVEKLAYLLNKRYR